MGPLHWLLLASLPVAAHAQLPPSAPAAPMRRANTVWLCTPAAPAGVLRALATHLQQRGYELDSVAYERGLVTTRPGIPPGTESWPLAMRLVRVPGGIRLTGTFVAEPMLLAWPVSYPAEFWGFDWSPAKKTFRELEATARAYPGGQVRFSREVRRAR
jgi:hypothetical protein